MNAENLREQLSITIAETVNPGGEVPDWCRSAAQAVLDLLQLTEEHGVRDPEYDNGGQFIAWWPREIAEVMARRKPETTLVVRWVGPWRDEAQTEGQQ